MGNTYSSDEVGGRMAGSFFGLIGCIVASVVFPPAAGLAVAAGMANTGYAIVDCATAKQDKPNKPGDFWRGVGGHLTLNGAAEIGVQAGDRGRGFEVKPYYGDRVEIERKREEKERRETQQKFEMIVAKNKGIKILTDQFDHNIRKYGYVDIEKVVSKMTSQQLKTYLKENQTFYEYATCLFETGYIRKFTGTFKEPINFSYKMIEITHTEAGKRHIQQIYVIRRDLAGIPKAGIVSHSALLLKSISNHYYILEYGVESDPNKVTLREIPKCSVDENKLNDGVNKWSKQKTGENIRSKNIYVEEIHQKMKEIVSPHNYEIDVWNCHVAQENTRRALGIKVENPYSLNPTGIYQEAIKYREHAMDPK